jgi:hypothetical protein
VKASNDFGRQEIDMNSRLATRRPLRAGIVRSVLGSQQTSIRHRSRTRIAGIPLFEIAFGPQRMRGEAHGHAKALIAIGDQATGVLAIGGLAQGIVAVGGLSEGLIAVGGCTLGLFAALGGVAVGAFAVGGVALGGVARGGVAIGGLSARGREAVSPHT